MLGECKHHISHLICAVSKWRTACSTQSKQIRCYTCHDVSVLNVCFLLTAQPTRITGSRRRWKKLDLKYSNSNGCASTHSETLNCMLLSFIRIYAPTLSNNNFRICNWLLGIFHMNIFFVSLLLLLLLVFRMKIEATILYLVKKCIQFELIHFIITH